MIFVTRRRRVYPPLIFVFLFVVQSVGFSNSAKADPYCVIRTIAGTGVGGYTGDGGPATLAQLERPVQIIFDAAGNLYVAEEDPGVVRKISPDGIIKTVVGNGTYGFSGDGGPATAAQFDEVFGIALDSSGNLFVTDNGNNRVRKITTDGIISTFAGTGTAGYSGDNGPAISAELNNPKGVALDGAGNLYVGERLNNAVRKISPGGTITTFAGMSAGFNEVYGIALDSSGNLYVADDDNDLVRKIDPAGVVTTVAGNGTDCYPASTAGSCTLDGVGDGEAATLASVSHPKGVALDAAGNLYIADKGNNRIRKVSAADNIITTIAGNGLEGFSGEGRLATSAKLHNPQGVAVAANGDVYIADTENHRVRKISCSSTPPPPPDTTAPTILFFTPSRGALVVSPPPTITVNFSEEMDGATINTSSFRVRRGRTAIVGRVTYDPAKYQAIFTPSAPLERRRTYNIIISTGVTDLEGNHLLRQGTSFFSTAP